MIRYMERTRTYYGTLGYPAYEWAQHDQVPFQIPAKPLNQCRLGLITTASPHQPELADQGPGAPYNAPAKFFQTYTVPTQPIPDLRISHLGYDRKHTTAADPNTWLPIARLLEAQHDGIFAELAPEVIAVPTNRSQRVTCEVDAAQALEHCQRLGVDVALLVPS
jgi:D-proline reductase (dithiol) PrdB